MLEVADFVPRFFGLPGVSTTDDVAEYAIASHERLLRSAANDSAPLGRLVECLSSSDDSLEHRELFSNPSFIEGLHESAQGSSVLRNWHRTVASPCMLEAFPESATTSASSLGSVNVALALRKQPAFCGVFLISTDVFGRVHFPYSDWILSLANLVDGQWETAALQEMTMQLGTGRVVFRINGEQPALVVPRDQILPLILGDSNKVRPATFLQPSEDWRIGFQRATKLRGTAIRFESITAADSDSRSSALSHAPTTCQVMEQLLSSIRDNSPELYNEICCYLRVIRGFELPAADDNLISSFSDPILPGVMNVNVSYVNDQPHLSPLAFLWLGHELGHTKSYLIDTIAYMFGITFVMNPDAKTEVVERYGRAICVRTLMQIPYVHLYEWTLLMDFVEKGFDRANVNRSIDVAEVGNEVAAEIHDGLALIDRYAVLTSAGELLVDHLRQLVDQVKVRWQKLIRSR